MDDQQKLRKAELASEIVRVGQILYAQKLIVAGEGNISVRLDADLLLLTPSRVCKGFLQSEDLICVNLAGEVVTSFNKQKPSTELGLHLQVYKARPDVQAIIHAHPPMAVATTLAGRALATDLLPEMFLTLGVVPTAPYAVTGTPEMAKTIEMLIPQFNALLLAHHGALTFGENLPKALRRMEQIEQCATILLAAQQLGGPQPLPQTCLAQLEELRQRLHKGENL